MKTLHNDQQFNPRRKLKTIYAPNIGAPQYEKQIFTNIKGEINSNPIIAGHFNAPLSSVDRSPRQKINKKI